MKNRCVENLQRSTTDSVRVHRTRLDEAGRVCERVREQKTDVTH